MSLLVGELFAKSPLLLYPLCGLVIFMIVFAGAAMRAWRQRPEERDALAQLPLEDQEVRRE
jgi:hypothetical protein